MLRIFLKAKIHRAWVTAARLDYEGSLTIDRNLMVRAEIAPYEQVQVYNLANGERFETYAIEGPEGSGEICLNGAAAHKGKPGDLVIVATYGLLDEKEMTGYRPRVVFVDDNNQPRTERSSGGRGKSMEQRARSMECQTTEVRGQMAEEGTRREV
jgi:aspartate 1-decarboxylase